MAAAMPNPSSSVSQNFPKNFISLRFGFHHPREKAIERKRDSDPRNGKYNRHEKLQQRLASSKNSNSSQLDPKKEVPVAMADDSEISIFYVHKYYFKESNIITTTEHQQHKESRRVSPEHRESQPGRARSFHATPKASSELPRGAIGVSTTTIAATEKKRNVSRRRWFLRRKCPCLGKKAVEIREEKVSERRSKKLTDKSNGIAGNPRKVVKKSGKSFHGRTATDRQDDDQDHYNHGSSIPSRPKFPQKSNFIPTQLAHRELTSKAGSSFPILSQPPPVKMEISRPSGDCITDSIPPRILAPNPPVGRQSPAMEDDVASDVSSDLFEIDSFTTTTATN